MVLLGAEFDRIKKAASKLRQPRKCVTTSKHLAEVVESSKSSVSPAVYLYSTPTTLPSVPGFSGVPFATLNTDNLKPIAMSPDRNGNMLPPTSHSSSAPQGSMPPLAMQPSKTSAPRFEAGMPETYHLNRRLVDVDQKQSVSNRNLTPSNLISPLATAASFSPPAFDDWWTTALRESGSDICREIPYSLRSRPASPALVISGERAMLAINRKLSQFSCRACNKRFDLGPADVIAKVKDMIAINGNVSAGYKCRHCTASNCLGCGVAATEFSKNHTFNFRERPSVSWCCEVGHLFLIWALCCGIDCTLHPVPQPAAPPADVGRSHFNLFKPSSLSKSMYNSAKTLGKKTIKSATPDGVGYGIPSLSQPLDISPYGARDSTSQLALLADDRTHQSYYLTLSRLLSSACGTTYDISSPAAAKLICQFVLRSPLLTKAVELLRNTSIQDIANRFDLYSSLSKFLTVLCNQPMLATILTHPRPIFSKYELLPSASFMTPSGADLGKEKEKEHDFARPISTVLQDMADLCNRVLRHSAKCPHEFLSDDGPKTLEICREFSSLHQKLADVSMQPPPTALAPKGKTLSQRSRNSEDKNKEQAEKAARWFHENCLDDIDDNVISQAHSFNGMIATVENAPKGRMRRLINDISMLRSSLPEGIFVRHGSSRLDVMKVLIIGPKDTPYEHGMFEFDLFCTLDFPQMPPLMRLVTTGKGQVRFNPNLYNDGTVCLSLLGTWHGQRWHPDQSSILQILVSIQAMIFCEEPYYNEPGREYHTDSNASVRENRYLQNQTIRHAILPWLTDLPETSSDGDSEKTDGQAMAGTGTVWNDVVRHHFEVNGLAILQMAKLRQGRATKDKEMVAELAQALQKHSFLGASA